jgi:hypothetical protein
MAEDVKRLRYFNGLILREEEFNLEQNYHIRMRRLHNRYLHGGGIVFGLDFAVSNQQHKVKVTKGMALDRAETADNEQTSREILLLEDTEVDLGAYAPSTSVYIWIQYAEEKFGIVPERGGDEEIYWREFGELKHATTKPDAGDKLLLGRVDVKADGAIDNDSFIYEENGQSLRITAGLSGASVETFKLLLQSAQITTNFPNLVATRFMPENDTGIIVSAERTRLTGKLDALGAAHISATLQTDGKLTVTTGGADITGATKLIGVLDVSQNATIDGDLNVGTNLDVTGNAVIDGSLSVAGALNFNSIGVTNNATIGAGLIVTTGNVNIQDGDLIVNTPLGGTGGDLTVTRSASIGSDASVGGNLSVGGTLSLTGQVTTNLNVLEAISATGDITTGAKVVAAVGLETAGTLKLPIGIAIDEISSDTTFSSPSASAVPTEAAVQAYVTQTITTAVAGAGKFVGEIFMLGDFQVASPAFPAVCINAPTQTITATSFPQLQPYLYAKPLRYDATGVNAIDFPVTNYAIVSNVLTWTFSNTAAVNAILAALEEDQLVHGSYANWLTVTNETVLAGVPAETRAITNINAGARTVSVAYTAADASGAVSGDLRFYLHRVSGAVNQARIFQTVGRGFITAGDSAGEWIGGLRRRDRMQGHWHGTQLLQTGTAFTSAAGSTLATGSTSDPITDGVNGTPRTGPTTDIRGLGVYAYIWARQYVP